MKFTEAQQQAIERNGNLIVSAAAGAGKTSVLSERVFRLISEGTGIERMLILTFTGTLYESEATVTWTPVEDVSGSTYIVKPTKGKKFYRVGM